MQYSKQKTLRGFYRRLLCMAIICLWLRLEIKDLTYRFGVSIGAVHDILPRGSVSCTVIKEVEFLATQECHNQNIACCISMFPSKGNMYYWLLWDLHRTVFRRKPLSCFLFDYKHHHTAKALGPIFPACLLIFVSRLFTESSDEELTRQSRLLKACTGWSGPGRIDSL